MFKRLFRAGTALALVLTPGLAFAQATQDADPALWVVKDDDTTSYLFGTVHVLKPGLSWFDEAVREAYDSSDQVLLEITDFDSPQAQATMIQAAMSTDGALRGKLPEALVPRYEAALQKLGLPAAALDQFKPWMAALSMQQVAMMRAGYDPTQGAEMAILSAAKEDSKQLAGLETIEEQLGFFNSLALEDQIGFLESTVDAVLEDDDTLDRMVALWSAGQADELGALMNEEMRDEPNLAKLLLTDRNARWAEWIDTRLDTPGTVFLAVGAGHLAGTDSVQQFLEADGLTVTRIEY